MRHPDIWTATKHHTVSSSKLPHRMRSLNLRRPGYRDIPLLKAVKIEARTGERRALLELLRRQIFLRTSPDRPEGRKKAGASLAPMTPSRSAITQCHQIRCSVMRSPHLHCATQWASSRREKTGFPRLASGTTRAFPGDSRRGSVKGNERTLVCLGECMLDEIGTPQARLQMCRCNSDPHLSLSSFQRDASIQTCM